MDMPLQVQVSCATADLCGKIVRIIAQDDTVLKEVELTTADETNYQTDEFVVTTPIEPGEYTWTAVFPTQATEDDSIRKAPRRFRLSSCPMPSAWPFGTSLRRWSSTPSFKLKVGAKCSAGCNLAGEEIDIYDHEGAKIATGVLGDTSLFGDG